MGQKLKNSELEELVKRHRTGLTFFIQRIVSDPDTAEDLAIDTFLELLIHPNRYDGRCSMKTYLYMIGRSKALNHLRRARWIHPEPIPEDFPADETLEAAYLKEERNRILHQNLQTLPPDQRMALHLVYLEGLSYKDTAAIMKKNEKQVDNLLRRGKAALRARLEKEDLF